MISYAFNDVARREIVDVAPAKDEGLGTLSVPYAVVRLRRAAHLAGVGQGKLLPGRVVLGGVCPQDGTDGRHAGGGTLKDGVVKVV